MGATHSSFNVEGGDYYKRVRAEAKAEKEKDNNTRDSNNNKDNNNNKERDCNKERDNNKRLGYPEEEEGAAAVEEEQRGWDQWTLGGSLNFFEEKGWDPVPEYKYHQYLRSRTYQ